METIILKIFEDNKLLIDVMFTITLLIIFTSALIIGFIVLNYYESLQDIEFEYIDGEVYLAKFEGRKWVIYNKTNGIKYSLTSRQTIFFNNLIE